MVGTAASIALFWVIPAGAPWWLMVVPFTLIGFFVYGPQALLGIAAANQATNRASATANGILGIFGYASSLISGVLFGSMADTGGWNQVFMISVIFGVVGAVAIGLMWKAPADGYEKLNKLIKDID
jgi:OPA family glycerol-3-phosphate transporter-like MFS transporter/OPA family sugar phosphate sensor protein UhpC-like MFS transporter